jgi:cytochrome c peroxidase
MSEAKVALGRKLFFEPMLSMTGKHSCASCHDPAHAFADSQPFSKGATGELTRTNAMSLTNVAYNVSFGWSRPDVRTLEEQMREPMLNEHPIELGLAGREAQVIEALAARADYRAAFAEAFPGSPQSPGGSESESKAELWDQIIKSIASYERTLISGHSPFDLYVFEGKHDALSAGAKRGMALFNSERVGCARCHAGFNFSGNWRDREGATGEPTFEKNGVSPDPVRVPTLRNVAVTAPYMHDGSLSTLEAVLDHYERAGARERTAQNDATLPPLRAFTLSPVERHELIEFLKSLTDTKLDTRSHGERKDPVPG